MIDNLPLKLQPKNGYVSKAAYNTAVSWLAEKGIMTNIKKVRRAKSYNVYADLGDGYQLRKSPKTRNSAKRYIWNLFIKHYNS